MRNDMNEIDFHIIIRKPVYPLIVISSDAVYPAFNIEELAQACIESTLSSGETYIKAIDSSAEEFWYSPEQYVITPGFLCKRWTKKQIIDLFNKMNQDGRQYSTKSLSAKRLDKIVLDLCNLLKNE